MFLCDFQVDPHTIQWIPAVPAHPSIHHSNLLGAFESEDKEKQADAYRYLGIIHDTRGKSDKAAQMFRKALELDKALDNRKGMAQDYGNLGIVYQTRGELNRAEEMRASQHYDAEIVRRNLDKLAQERSSR